MRHIPFGPVHPHPSLSSSSLTLLYRHFFRHEHAFLPTIPSLWTGVDRSKSIFTLGHAFEVLAFAKGLKPAIIVGFGDGRDMSTEGGGKVAGCWVQEVWNKVKDDLERLVKGENGSQCTDTGEKSDVSNLLDFMNTCVFHTMGDLSGQSSIFTGHLILYYPPSSPSIRLITSVPPYDPSSPDSDSSRGPPVSFDESLFAHILGYPTVLPSEDIPNRSSLVQTITLGILFRDSIIIAQDFQCFARPTPRGEEDEKAVEQHWRLYREELGEVLKGAEIALSWDGRWQFPEMGIEGRKGLESLQEWMQG